ncbi:MAG: radical SAM family heme chaperone HemW [Pseudomonadota bacterium]
MSAFGPDHGFGLYVHWPYCSKICPYCDFNVYTAKDRDNGPLVDAILKDISAHHRRFGSSKRLDTIYFGGGTPSLLPVGDVARIIERTRSLYGLREGAEISLEANPNDLLRADLQGLRSAGVNRLSIGVQSLRDEALDFLGRDHDGQTAVRAVDAALPHFQSVSIDLIYARPGQSSDDWGDELSEALKLGAPHLSLYELTIEERTAFGHRAARGDLVPMEDDAQADLYELTEEITRAAGLPAYEVSNYAASTSHQSQHNLIYWRGGDWIGIGPGAHGRMSEGDKRFALEAARRPADYIATSGDDSRLATPKTALSSLEVARELVAMGLRPAEGIDRERIETLTGAPLDPELVERFETAGLLKQNGSTIALTAAGRLLADRIAADLAP